ncbi:DUF4097 domain-containing protein [Marinoscillum pacificum]|uniref:DUF4097 domain-containing protein n=1 Tax=Marinoscillum pacificum TaxID=392723 RepID=UPI002157373C|nr:DUF4097 domain-containing protein [Marinoscillum pacificum]
MKRIILLTITALLVNLSFAQDIDLDVKAVGYGRQGGVEKTFKLTPKGNASDITLSIENFYGDITIAAVNTPELVISTKNYEGVPEKAQGLKPLSATGSDNTDIGLSVTQKGNVIKVSAASRKADGHYLLKVPQNMKVKADLNSWQAGDFVVSGLTNEIDVKTQNGDVILRNVKGPVVANTLSGDITVIFTGISQTTPTSITSTSGDIDVTLPTSTKGAFKLSTISGEVYTDVNFDVKNEEGMRRMAGGMSVDATLNGGGVNILLKSISGDVYIRKDK